MRTTLARWARHERAAWAAAALLGAASAYALAVADAVRALPYGDAQRALLTSTTAGWPALPFLALLAPLALLAAAAALLAARGNATQLGPWAMSPVRRAIAVAAPLLAAPFALTQDDLPRRTALLSFAVAASAGLAAFLAPRSPAPADDTAARTRLRALAYHAPVLAVIVVHAVTFSALTILRDRAGWSATVDLGIFKEALWNTLHGRPLYSPTVGYSFLGEHFSPVLFLLVPFYALSPTSATILIIQACAVSLAAWPIYRLALANGLGRALATCVAAAMIFAPPMQHALLYDFHMDLLGVPALAWAILAMHERRYRALAVAAALLCSVKEDAFIPLVGLSLATYFGDPERRSRRAALILGASALVYCALAIAVFVRYFGPPPGVATYMGGDAQAGYKFMRNFGHFTGPTGGFVLVTRPVRFLLWAFSDARLTTLFVLLAPTLFAPLFARSRVFLMAPAAILLLSDNDDVTRMNYHYGAMQQPGVFAAGVYGMAAWLARVRPGREGDARRALAVAVAAAALVSAGTSAQSAFSATHAFDARRVTARSRETDRLAALVPAGAPVSATSFGGPRFSNRRSLWMFPRGLDGAEYVFVDLQRPAWPATPGDRDMQLLALLRGRAWGVLGWHDGAVVLARGADPSRNRDAARELFVRRTYEVEGTEGTDFANAVVADASAADGYARVVRPNERRAGQWVVFGPFVQLTFARYRVTFRLRAQPAGLPPGDVGSVDVFSRGTTLAAHTLRANDFPDASWRDVTLEFDSRGLPEIEFRVRTERRWTLGADRITVTPVDGEEPGLRRLGF